MDVLAFADLRVAESGDVELATIERCVIRESQPPLNLIGVETPWRPGVKAARAELVEASRKWARDHGFDA